ncbi:hypothetical protein ACHAXN_005042 [Cyclotella atomus]
MKVLLPLVFLAYTSIGSGFSPVHNHVVKSQPSAHVVSLQSTRPPSNTLHVYQTKSPPTITAATKNGQTDDDQEGLSINPPYAVAFISFLSFAFYRSFTEADGASTKILEGFFADPLNPGCNELFVTIFNLLGLYFVPLACLLMPGAKGQKLPATPFVLASMLGGYGFLGPYMITRKPSMEIVNKSDLGWITANVLENKIINWGLAAIVASAYVSSGFFNALISDPKQLISGYQELFTDTAIASASSMDFLILTLVAASLVPEDLARRGVKKGIAPYAAAFSTVLWPGVGAALYCALRPELEE